MPDILKTFKSDQVFNMKKVKCVESGNKKYEMVLEYGETLNTISLSVSEKGEQVVRCLNQFLRNMSDADVFKAMLKHNLGEAESAELIGQI